jgi:large subunit ribosomal protein LP0
MVAKKKKVQYFAHLEEALNTYSRAFIVDADFVGSKQISDIRVALRGKAELIFGKNTMIRRCIRNMCEADEKPEWMAIVDVMRGNLGFVFTNGTLADLEEVILEYVKPAQAKAGVIAPLTVTIPKGPTGLDPAQTSFFQALNIATKINKGSIEMLNDTIVIREGEKVGTSEAALLVKLGLKPFYYGLGIRYVYEGGVFDPSVLKITDAELMKSWTAAMGFVAAISLATGFTTEASLPHLVIGGMKNIVATALEADFIEFPEVEKVKLFLDDPDAFVENQLREVLWGRVAMVAFVGICAQAWATRDGPVANLVGFLADPARHNVFAVAAGGR